MKELPRVPDLMVQEILSKPENKELINRLADLFHDRRNANPAEDRSQALEAVLAASREYAHGTSQFKRVISAEVQSVEGTRRVEKLANRSRRPGRIQHDWLSRWENSADERMVS